MHVEAQHPRPAELMSWAEVEDDLEAGRECTAIIKARSMLQAGFGGASAAKRVLLRLRAPMRSAGFFAKPAGHGDDVLKHDISVRRQVHDGMAREAVDAGILTRTDWLHEAQAVHRNSEGVLNEAALYAEYCRVFQVIDPANAPADWCTWLEGFGDAV